ncbi:MAG TPA: restriction endonuclease subunit S [Nostocaceae cyanobacterium]|nr:restriction endonuclease subunit S [Nostocaceae cyanobacterium]
MSQYPPSWTEVTLGDLLQFNYGKSLPNRIRSGTGFPIYGSNGVVGYHDNALTDGETLIIGRKGSVGEVHFSATPCFPIDTTYYVDQFHDMPARYWLYQLKNLQLSQLNKATAIPGLNRKDAYQIKINLPPLKEQKRIADKLDNLLMRVDTCRKRLNSIPLILKHFRQAVLTAATSGQLTEEWRDTQGINKTTNWVSLGDVASEFSYGSSAKSSASGSVPVLRMGNIQEGKLDWSNLVFTSDIKEIEKYQLFTGDVLFNRTNSPELVGKTAVYKGERPAIFAGYLIRIRCSADLIPDYLSYCLNSPAGRDYCRRVKSDAISQSNINAKKLAAFEFELPSIEEQAEIIRRTEILFDFADCLEARYKAAYVQVERLVPALLDKAFRGELITQNPNDEPASVLLDKIRTQRAAKPAETKRYKASRKSTMTKMTKESVKEVIRQLPKDKFSFDELRENLPGDYDSLKNILFALLNEPEPSLKQVFDQEAQAMRFLREGREDK